MVVEIDVVVAGRGVVPGLVALALTAREPSLRVALVTPDPETGGSDLDLVLPRRLTASFRALLDPLIVAEWPRALINLAESSAVLEEPIALVDPVQLWLQLAERIDPDFMFTACKAVEQRDQGLHWQGGALACAKVIDLSQRLSPARQTELMGADEVAALDCPVLADLAAAGEHYDHLQYIPLGDARVAINRFQLTAEFGGQRAAFTADRLDRLPVLRFWRELGELCAGLLGSD